MTQASDMGSNITNNDNEFLKYNDLYMVKGEYDTPGIRIDSIPDVNATFKFLNIELLQDDLQQSVIDVEEHIDNFKNNIFQVQTNFANSFNLHRVPAMVRSKLNKGIKITKQILSALDLWLVTYNDSLVNVFLVIDKYNKIKNDLVLLKYKIEDRSADIVDMEPLKFYKLKESYVRTLKRERTKLTSAENDIRKNLFDIITYINTFNRGIIPIGPNSTESININLINNATKMIYGEIIPWEQLQIAISKRNDGGSVNILYNPRSVPDTVKTMQPIIDKYTHKSNGDKRKHDEPQAKKLRKETIMDVDPKINLIENILQSKNHFNQQLENINNAVSDADASLPETSRLQLQNLNKLNVASDNRMLSDSVHNMISEILVTAYRQNVEHANDVSPFQQDKSNTSTPYEERQQLEMACQPNTIDSVQQNVVNQQELLQDSIMQTDETGDEQIVHLLKTVENVNSDITTLENDLKLRNVEIDSLKNNQKQASSILNSDILKEMSDLRDEIHSIEVELSSKNDTLMVYDTNMKNLTEINKQQYEINQSYKSTIDALKNNFQSMLNDKNELLKLIDDERNNSSTSQKLSEYEEKVMHLTCEIEDQKIIIEQYKNMTHGSVNEQIDSIINDQEIKQHDNLRVANNIIGYLRQLLDDTSSRNKRLENNDKYKNMKKEYTEQLESVQLSINDMLKSKNVLIKANEDLIVKLQKYSVYNGKLLESNDHGENNVNKTLIKTNINVDLKHTDELHIEKKIKTDNNVSTDQQHRQQQKQQDGKRQSEQQPHGNEIFKGTLQGDIFVINTNEILNSRFSNVNGIETIIACMKNTNAVYNKIQFDITLNFDTRGIEKPTEDYRNFVKPKSLLEEADKNITIGVEIARVLAYYWIYNETTALFINTVIVKISQNLFNSDVLSKYLPKIIENDEEFVYEKYLNILNNNSLNLESSYIELKAIVKNIPIENDETYKKFKALLEEYSSVHFTL